jgi:poly(A) polymerase
MLRAARLAGKLGFTIDAATEKPIAELAPLLANVPSARMYDEMLKVLFSGHSVVCIDKLRTLKLNHHVIPAIHKVLADPESGAFVRLALQRTDERINADKGVSPPFLFAALFWFAMRTRQEKFEADGMRNLQAWHEAMDDVLEHQRKTLAIPRRLDPMIKELWIAQPRFLQRSKVKAYRLLESPRFRANYDFFALRAEVDDAEKEIAEWWEKFQFADDDTREAMLLPDDEPKKKRRRRRRKVGGAVGAESGAGADDVSSQANDGPDESWPPSSGA